MALTAKQECFVAEYLIDLCATKAAIRAGYSKRTADQQGSRLLKNPKVAAAIVEAKAKRAKRTEINSDWVLNRLTDEAEADLADIFDDNMNLKPVHEWPDIWRKGLVAGVDVVEEFETVDGEKKRVSTVHKIKLSDRIKRIELIGKHVMVQAFKDQIDASGTITLNVSREDAEL